MRIGIFDGLRGFFLVFMMIVHANGVLDALLGKLNHHYFGWVEDAQGFVFISGFVVALVYGGTYLRKGEIAMRVAVWSRMITIYWYHASLMLMLLAVSLILSALGLPQHVFTQYQQEPLLFTAASLLLLTGSMHMGILPMYVIFMAFTPFFLGLLHRGYYISLLMISLLMWFIAQSGICEVFRIWIESASALNGHPLKFGIFFNILGWQVVFFSGVTLGFLAAKNKLRLDFLLSRDCYYAALVGSTAFILLGLYDRVAFDDWLGGNFSVWILSQTDRGNFSLIYVLSYALDAFLLAWLIVAGRQSGNAAFVWLSGAVQRVLTSRPLMLLGRHSLQVFSAHIVLVYALHLVFEGNPPSALLANILILLSPLPLFLVAWLHALYPAEQRRMRATGMRPTSWTARLQYMRSLGYRSLHSRSAS